MEATIKQELLDYVRTRLWNGEAYAPAFATPAAEAQYLRRLDEATTMSKAHLQQWRDAGASGVGWVTIIDARAAPLCRVLSGTKWDIRDDRVLTPPVHVDCRCMLTPIYGTGPRHTLNYEVWLRHQPQARQDSILGETLAHQFRAGRTLHAMLDEMVYGN